MVTAEHERQGMEEKKQGRERTNLRGTGHLTSDSIISCCFVLVTEGTQGRKSGVPEIQGKVLKR